MIITKTPFRVSYFGGGTDYPSWYIKNKGMTISTSINKFSYIILNEQEKINNFKMRIRYFKKEQVNYVDEIKHPTIRNVFKFFKIKHIPNLDLIHFNDIPAQTGVGSSSAFSVGLINAITKYYKIKKNKYEISRIATFIEQVLNKENIGSQDQLACGIGGFNCITYFKDKIKILKNYSLNNKNIKQIENSSILVYSNKKRMASKIAGDVIKNTKGKKNYFNEIFNLSEEAKSLLDSQSYNNKIMGELINESWQLKKNISKFINIPEADEIINFAKSLGSYGGKILGAGGGGMVLLFSEKKINNKIEKKLKNFQIIKFKFENNGTVAKNGF